MCVTGTGSGKPGAGSEVPGLFSDCKAIIR